MTQWRRSRTNCEAQSNERGLVPSQDGVRGRDGKRLAAPEQGAAHFGHSGMSNLDYGVALPHDRAGAEWTC